MEDNQSRREDGTYYHEDEKRRYMEEIPFPQCTYMPDSPTLMFHFKNFDTCPIGSGKCAIAHWHDFS